MKLIRCKAVALLLSIACLAQSPDAGRELYAKVSKSVLLLKVVSSSGEEIALGSGFLVNKGQIVTNAHVASGGKILVEIGPVRIPARVTKSDSQIDLALLAIETELSLTPLKLAAEDAKPGDTIYAIGNPEGLERSISQGLVAAERSVEGRKLLQITSAISHGSSGGPILNTHGEVIGVAVGILQSGQNLNFAVPVSNLNNFLRSESSSPVQTVKELLAASEQINKAQQADKYSDDADSPYQQKEAEKTRILQQALEKANRNVADLLEIAGQASTYGTWDVAIKAAETANQLRPDSETKLLLSSALSSSVFWEDRNSPTRKASLARAEKLARSALEGVKQPTFGLYYQLADVLEDELSALESLKYYRLALSVAPDSSAKAKALRGLLRQVSDESEADRLFSSLQQMDTPDIFDWRQRGEWLSDRERYSDAAVAYHKAASSELGYYTDWCECGRNAFLAANFDVALPAERKCIELGATRKDSESRLGFAHRLIAAMLNERGVYSEALSHAKEAANLIPSDAFAYSNMADALLSLHRYQEAINSANQAIRLSDGKYASMHFTLASAYFQTENWDFARQSFEKAAELQPKDDISAYNVAVCYVRLGYYLDAARWYEEVLRRNPSHKDRTEILQRIRSLRQ